jgi:hypothetical protein
MHAREKLSTSDRESLHEMIKTFLAENFYRDLSNVPCAGTIEPHLLIEFFSNNIQQMVLSYAELGYFLYKNPSMYACKFILQRGQKNKAQNELLFFKVVIMETTNFIMKVQIKMATSW